MAAGPASAIRLETYQVSGCIPQRMEPVGATTWLYASPPTWSAGLSSLCGTTAHLAPPHPTLPSSLEVGLYLHKLQVLVGQLALGELVFLCDPWVLQHLLGCEALVGVHMQHLGH